MEKRTVVSLGCISAVLILSAVLVRWAAPRFGLNMGAQIAIYAAILFVAKLVYFLGL